MTALTAWSFGALYYMPLPSVAARWTLAMVFPAFVLAAFLLLKRRRAVAVFFVGVGVVLVCYLCLSPSHDREWMKDVALLPHATFAGDRCTVHNVRNLEWHGPSECTPRYDTRTYDLSKLEGVDLILSYWDGNEGIAHVMHSFGFNDGSYLALSVETRMEVGETYSPTAGFFRQFELIYVLADERDLLGVRARHRAEELYLYPARYTVEEARTFLRGILNRVNEIHDRPVFYNAIAENCLTSMIPIFEEIRRDPPHFDIRVLLNGHLDEFAYEIGRLVADESHGLPFDEMRRKHAVSPTVKRLPDDASFSKNLRAQLPRRTR
ncbi:MAG: DUF4105 domain-containing protein [Planctomycetota bacterium]